MTPRHCQPDDFLQGAYRGLMLDEIFDLVDCETRLWQWDRYLAKPKPRHNTWVAEAATGQIGPQL